MNKIFISLRYNAESGNCRVQEEQQQLILKAQLCNSSQSNSEDEPKQPSFQQILSEHLLYMWGAVPLS